MSNREQLMQKMLDAFEAWRVTKLALDAIKAARSKLTAPHYKAKNKIEAEYKPLVDDASIECGDARAFLEVYAEDAFAEGAFGVNDKGEHKARYELEDGSWVQIEKEQIELEIADWTVLLLDETLRDIYVESVTIKLNPVALARAKTGKKIPGVVVRKTRPVKLHIAKPKPVEEEV